MASSGLEWDPLDCPLVGLPIGCKSSFHTDSDKPDPWHGRVNSLWSLSSATGCSPSSRTWGSRGCRLKQEEEEEEVAGRRKAGKEPGGPQKEEVSSATPCRLLFSPLQTMFLPPLVLFWLELRLSFTPLLFFQLKSWALVPSCQVCPAPCLLTSNLIFVPAFHLSLSTQWLRIPLHSFCCCPTT